LDVARQNDLAGRFRAALEKFQLRVACQLPLHLSPVMIPLQRPVPELPTSAHCRWHATGRLKY
jgi:hypothetical protein